MATQFNSLQSFSAGGMTHTVLELKLITSGTTVTYTLTNLAPVAITFYNKTTGALPSGGTFVESTGVYTSPTMVVNDVCEVVFTTR